MTKAGWFVVAAVLGCVHVNGFVPVLRMKVGANVNSQRASAKAVGILGATAENVARNQNPTQVMVSNLPFAATQDDLAAFAAQAGSVVAAKVIVDRETGRSKGYGFVTFEDALGATIALEKLNGAEMLGRPLKIMPARKRVEGQWRPQQRSDQRDDDDDDA